MRNKLNVFPTMPVCPYLIDFGLTRRYLDDEGRHSYEHAEPSGVGNVYFMSRAASAGSALSRRDDLEQLLYVLVFLAKGRLPWFNLDDEVHD